MYRNLKPFTYVLGRDNETDVWVPDIFSKYCNDEVRLHPYICFKSSWTYCIPYKGNEHLAFTANSFFKPEFGDLVEVNLSTGTFLAVFIQKTDDVATVVPYSDVAELVKVCINDIKPYKE